MSTPTTNPEESECGWCKDKWGLSWQIPQRPNAHLKP